ncbi:MAG: hypothetical protein GY946_03860 [bacterium]|nr:hypothetical protein [bacterium]
MAWILWLLPCAVALLPMAPAAAAPRVVLIGLDGASWSVIDPLVEAGRLPNLMGLLERGVHAELETVEPVISPVVWTSVATGQPPDVHGIGDFFGNARSRLAPTIFERAAVQGLRVGTLEWLVSWPAQELPDGFVAPAWLRRDDTTSPGDLFARAGIPRYAYSNQGLRSRAEFFETSFEETRRKASTWNKLAATYELDAGAVTFYALDALSHRFWADSFPEGFDPDDLANRGLEPEFQHAVQKGYEAIDRAIGELVAALPDDSAVLIASDHGFQAGERFERRWSFTLEEELAMAGLVPGREAFRIDGQFGLPTLRVLSGPFDEREPILEQLVTFFEGAHDEHGAALFNVVVFDQAERPAGHERSWGERLKQWGFRMAARWLYSVEFDMPAHAMLILIPEDEALEAAWPNGQVTLGGQQVPIRQVAYGDGFTGTHHPTAVFIGAGGPIRAADQRQQLSVLDIAPLFLHLAGVAIPDDLEGELPLHFLAKDWLEAHPIRDVPASDLPRLPAPTGPEHEDAALVERLRAMGYID